MAEHATASVRRRDFSTPLASFASLEMAGTRFGRFARGVASHSEIIWLHTRNRSGKTRRFDHARSAILLDARGRVEEKAGDSLLAITSVRR